MLRLLPVISFAMLLAAESALACSPVPPIYGDSGRVSAVIASDTFQKELDAQFKANFSVGISSIDLKGGTKFNLTNGCVINAYLVYGEPPSPGMCPEFKGVVASTKCP